MNQYQLMDVDQLQILMCIVTSYWQVISVAKLRYVYQAGSALPRGAKKALPSPKTSSRTKTLPKAAGENDMLRAYVDDIYVTTHYFLQIHEAVLALGSYSVGGEISWKMDDIDLSI